MREVTFKVDYVKEHQAEYKEEYMLAMEIGDDSKYVTFEEKDHPTFTLAWNGQVITAAFIEDKLVIKTEDGLFNYVQSVSAQEIELTL